MSGTYSFADLQDMIIPEVWNQYILQESVVLTTFLRSGIVGNLPQVGALLGGGGTSVNMPFFNDLDMPNGDPAPQVIDDTQDANVNGISTAMDVAVVQERFAAFGSTDLAGDLSGSQDPLAVIASRFGAYWAREDQQTLLSLCAGVMGSASMASNVLNISGAPGGAGVFDASAFIDAKYALGDHATELTAVAVHSSTMRLMEQQDLIDYIKPSDGGMPIPTYMGKMVIVNDTMPVTVVNGSPVYTSYLFGAGVVGYAEGTVKVPVELYREPLFQMGRESLIHRRKFAMHIRGVKWIGNGFSGGPTANNADLANSANWNRVYNPKLIKIVSFQHRNA